MNPVERTHYIIDLLERLMQKSMPETHEAIRNLMEAVSNQSHDVEELAKTLRDHVNNFSLAEDEFAEVMSRQHRTLQQSFTRLCLVWIEHLATNEHFDDRNKASHEVAKDIVEGYHLVKIKDGNDYGEMSKQPGKWLPTI